MRRAVFLAIDRQELVKIARCAEPYGCFGSAGTFLPNKGGKVVESPEDLAQVQGWRQPKDQDITEAKALMAAAGYGILCDRSVMLDNNRLSWRLEPRAEELFPSAREVLRIIRNNFPQLVW